MSDEPALADLKERAARVEALMGGGASPADEAQIIGGWGVSAVELTVTLADDDYDGPDLVGHVLLAWRGRPDRIMGPVRLRRLVGGEEIASIPIEPGTGLYKVYEAGVRQIADEMRAQRPPTD